MAQLQVFSWQCTRRQDYFVLVFWANPFLKLGLRFVKSKQKERTYGYKGLAFKSTTPSPSVHLLSLNGVKTWISDNYVEGSTEDVKKQIRIVESLQSGQWCARSVEITFFHN